MDKTQIVIIDDSQTLLRLLGEFVRSLGYTAATASSAKEGLALIGSARPELVLLDIKMPETNGLELLSLIKQKDPKLSVVMMTAYGTTQTAIEAMKRGAYEYVTKPFNNEELKDVIRKALEAARLVREPISLRKVKKSGAGEACIVGKGPLMMEVYKTIGKVADSSATVLIRGESGTGKELVARALYQNSSRKDKPFLAVNCAAIPETLLESELFGHEKGSFTGAINKRVGKFQQCEAGTILLDEIGDMSLAIQAKVLRVLQEHTFQPVGSDKNVTVDVRVLASTNKDLWKAIQAGSFREDLYYRLKVITIYMPPLRQRKEDIPLLVEYFLKKFNAQFNKTVKRVHPDTMKRLLECHWPGNVRELENAVQTAVLMSKKDVLSLEDFPVFGSPAEAAAPEFSGSGSGIENELSRIVQAKVKNALATSRGDLYKQVSRDLERLIFETVLREAKNSQSKAAKVLGISRNTLRSRLKDLGLSHKP